MVFLIYTSSFAANVHQPYCTPTNKLENCIKNFVKKMHLKLLSAKCVSFCWGLNTLRPRQNGRHFADDTFKRIFLNENVRISIKISLKFVPKDPINNNPALVQIMAWRRSGDKPLSEPMMVCFLTHICVTRPQWVNMFTGSHLITPWYCRRSRSSGLSPGLSCSDTSMCSKNTVWKSRLAKSIWKR